MLLNTAMLWYYNAVSSFFFFFFNSIPLFCCLLSPFTAFCCFYCLFYCLLVLLHLFLVFFSSAISVFLYLPLAFVFFTVFSFLLSFWYILFFSYVIYWYFYKFLLSLPILSLSHHSNWISCLLCYVLRHVL